MNEHNIITNMEVDLGLVEITIEIIMVITKHVHVVTYPTIVLIVINEIKPFAMVKYTMKNCICENYITLQLKFKKQFIYNCYATIPWVLQLLCNYPLGITTIMQLSF